VKPTSVANKREVLNKPSLIFFIKVKTLLFREGARLPKENKMKNERKLIKENFFRLWMQRYPESEHVMHIRNHGSSVNILTGDSDETTTIFHNGKRCCMSLDRRSWEFEDDVELPRILIKNNMFKSKMTLKEFLDFVTREAQRLGWRIQA